MHSRELNFSQDKNISQTSRVLRFGSLRTRTAVSFHVLPSLLNHSIQIWELVIEILQGNNEVKRGQFPLIEQAGLCHPQTFHLGLTYKRWKRRKDYSTLLGFPQQITEYLVTETEIFLGS